MTRTTDRNAAGVVLTQELVRTDYQVPTREHRSEAEEAERP